MKKRMANLELLRSIAMLMVVLLHYLSKGNYLLPLVGEMTITGYVSWLLESFAIVAVNVYMLLSGYFLVESGFKVERLIELVCQVVFYSVLVPIILILCGILSVEEITTHQILQYIFPTQMLHYWFVTAYVLMYLFLPILSAGVKTVSKVQLQTTIVLLLLVLSVSKSLLPVRFGLDNSGYDVVWFICVFLIAAYIRLYGIPFFENASKSFICYLLAACGIFVVTFGVRAFFFETGRLVRVIEVAYSYNHVLVLFGAIALFYTFTHLKILAESFVGKIACFVGPYTFGVYLLHEQIEVRFLWPEWLKANPSESVPSMLIHTFVSVSIVFLIGVIVDFLRAQLFKFVKGLWRKTTLYAKITAKR